MIRPLVKGFKRQWVRCKTCGKVQYYDYQPYSLSNPIRTSACGHGAAQRLEDWTESISADEALIELLKEKEEKPLLLDDLYAGEEFYYVGDEAEYGDRCMVLHIDSFHDLLKVPEGKIAVVNMSDGYGFIANANSKVRRADEHND